MIKLNETNFEQNTSTGLILVEFYASWCGYCRKQNEILSELENITIGQVDGDESPNLTRKYGITGFPSFVIFKNGKAVDRFSGLHSKTDLMKILMQHFFD